MYKDSSKKYIRVISFLSFLSVLLIAATVVSTARAEKYRIYFNAGNEAAMNELCENLDNISLMLEKSIYAFGKEMPGRISSSLSRSSACAKVSLGALTQDTESTDEIYKFLSQVGDFTQYLSKKAEQGKTLSEKEKSALRSLLNYSKALSQAMDETREAYLDKGVAFEKSLSNISLEKEEEPALFSSKINDLSQSLVDYPTLIYDGPFADSVLQREPVMLKNKNEITAEEAKKKAAEILKADLSSIRQDSDETGSLDLYCFSVGEKAMGITKKGGYVCYITNPDFCAESTISEKEAVVRGKKYLKELGYREMTESYYSNYDGVCTINFAHEKNGTIFYADLIKVSVRLDTGEVCALDARGYLMNHRERTEPKKLLSAAACKKKLPEGLSLISTKNCVAPLNDGTEKFCTELHCKSKDNSEYLIYIDRQTGEECNVLLLLYSDGGQVTK